jgi:Uma2 family endonuclease
MSPVTKPKRTMTLEEFHAWNGEPDTSYELIDGVPVAMHSPSYELIDGVPVAMTSPKWPHRRIVVNLTRHVAIALDRRRPCAAEVEAGILSPTRRDTYYQADLAVSCTSPCEDQVEMTDPILIVEVLSPSTEDQDRKVKLVDYRRIPSVREILLVDSKRRYCELHRRLEGDRWLTELSVDPESVLHLESIDADLRLSDIYANVELEQDKQPEQATPETQAATE